MKHWFWVDVYFVTPRMGSLPGPSVHGILQARIQEWVAIPFCRESIFPTQALSPGLLHCRKILFQLSHKGSIMFKTLYYYIVFRAQTCLLQSWSLSAPSLALSLLLPAAQRGSLFAGCWPFPRRSLMLFSTWCLLVWCGYVGSLCPLLFWSSQGLRQVICSCVLG